MIDHKRLQQTMRALNHARQDAYRHTEAMRRITSLRAGLCDVLDTDRDGLPEELAEAFAMMLDWASAENDRAAERVSRWSAEWSEALHTLRTEGLAPAEIDSNILDNRNNGN